MQNFQGVEAVKEKTPAHQTDTKGDQKALGISRSKSVAHTISTSALRKCFRPDLHLL